MFGLQRLIVLVTLITSTFVLAAPHHHDDSLVDWGRLSAILDSIDDNILHSVLHNLAPKFRDGVFSKDRAAIEHVHSSNPIMASKLVYLAKRQNATTTASTPAVVVSSSSLISSSTARTSAANNAVTTTTSVASVAPAVSAAVSSQLTQSALPAPTTILIPPTVASGATAISTGAGGIVISTIGGGVATLTSSALSVRFTKSTSTHIFTVTGADGQLTTSTSIVVVNAPVTGIATGAAAAATTSGPGLQSDASQSSIVSIFGAIVAGILGLFVAL